jgi:hypothetical protein
MEDKFIKVCYKECIKWNTWLWCVGLTELLKMNYDLDSHATLNGAVSKPADTADQRNVGSRVISVSIFLNLHR